MCAVCEGEVTKQRVKYFKACHVSGDQVVTCKGGFKGGDVETEQVRKLGSRGATGVRLVLSKSSAWVEMSIIHQVLSTRVSRVGDWTMYILIYILPAPR
jgi:hypothetical protein